MDVSTILAERGLSQAEWDFTARCETDASKGELKQRMLDRIRGSFGL